MAYQTDLAHGPAHSAAVATQKYQTITFDQYSFWDLYAEGDGGLNWHTLSLVDGYDSLDFFGESGFYTGMVSEAMTISTNQNGDGHFSRDDGANFGLQSLYMTAAFRDGLEATIVGYDDGVEKFRKTVVVGDEAPTFVKLGWVGVDDVVFSSTGGTPGETYDSRSVVMDNIRLITTPGTITGSVFRDSDADGLMNGRDAGLANRFVFADYDGDGLRDKGEVFARTDANGNYTLEKVAFGVWNIAVANPGAGSMAESHSVTVDVGSTTAGVDFAVSRVPVADAFGAMTDFNAGMTLRHDLDTMLV